MGMTIPDEILRTAHMSEAEMLQEIAVLLYVKEKITLAQASRLAAMARIEFQHLLASRGIPVSFGVSDFEEDLDTLRSLGRL
jgi:predicted HTH domain antitoxin